MKLAVTATALALALSTGCERSGSGQEPLPTHDKSLIVLGIDGMDPTLLRQYFRDGKLPNLKRLADQGGFIDLGTTDPPQSPVAWSAFITGLGLGGHGIYDFVHRDPVHLEPYLSTSRTEEKSTLWGISSEPSPVLLRGGDAFWEVLERGEVPATVVKIPANFPPVKTRSNVSTSGMGTPDLMGTYGVYQVFTTDAELGETSLNAGVAHLVDFGAGQSARSTLDGPEGQSLDVEIVRDRQNPVLMIRLGEAETILQEGEWSAWVPISFGEGMVTGGMPGMVRLYLRSMDPLHLYVSPINLDPVDSYLPISEPPAFAVDMARRIGRFYTQGMAEDTKALTGGVLSDEEFLDQAGLVLSERREMLRDAMKSYDSGLFFFYFSSIDQVSHMYYGSLVPESLAKYRKYDYVVPQLYEEMDEVVGEVLEWAGDRPVVVMSDHGFAPYRYKVHLNTWLAQQGYLSLMPKGQSAKGALGHIDWENTQAYALGLNQLFINVEGREARGVVTEPERDVLVKRLQRELESWYHEGERVVTRAMVPEVGTYPERAPDLIVGYNRGYRSSDPSAQGAVGPEVIEVNDGHWNGDHCMHASHVPGVLLSSMPLAVDSANLVDLPVSILSFFDEEPAEGMEGQVVWKLDQDTP